MATALLRPCAPCAGSGLSARDPENNCSDCGGHGEQIRCSVCDRWEVMFVSSLRTADPCCRPCWADHRRNGVSLEVLRERWALEHAEEVSDLYVLEEQEMGARAETLGAVSL